VRFRACGFRASVLGFWGLRFRVVGLGLGFRVQGLLFSRVYKVVRVWGLRGERRRGETRRVRLTRSALCLLASWAALGTVWRRSRRAFCWPRALRAPGV